MGYHGQTLVECCLDTGCELVTLGWGARARGSEVKRPETPKDPWN